LSNVWDTIEDSGGCSPASRTKIQSNLVVLVPGPRPVCLLYLVKESRLMCEQEQKERKATAALKPRPRGRPRVNKTRSVGPRGLVRDWLEKLPENPLQRGDSQTSTHLREGLSAMTSSQPTVSLLYGCMDVDQDSTNESEIYQALLQRPRYRHTLSMNGIRTVSSHEGVPEHISQMLKHILPEEPFQVCNPDQAMHLRLRDMAIEGTRKDEVRFDLSSKLFSNLAAHHLELNRGAGHWLERSRVPTTEPDDIVITPKPDQHLGYCCRAFPVENLHVLREISNSIIKFPFLEIEYEGDGSDSSGRLWTATNQCLGGTATFLNILDHFKAQLNHRSLKTQSEVIEPIVFSVVTNGTEARLFGSFSDGQGNFNMFLIKGFLLYEDQGLDKLVAYLTKIIEWGKGTRLDQIRDAVKALSESFKAAENPQIENHGFNIGGEEEEGSPTPAPQAANTVAGRPLKNGQGEQPAQVRGRGRPKKRSREQVKGKVGRPRKKPRPT
ncbi:unnamed protein product, partial [Clonostachys byssicola]